DKDSYFQFAYQNPLIYSDPSGMITMAELNVSRVIEDILQTIRVNGQREAIDKAKGIVSNVVNDVLKIILPADLDFIDNVQNKIERLPSGVQNTGDLLEDLVIDAAFIAIGWAFPQFSSILWREPEILSDGTPVYNGKQYGEPKDPTSKMRSGQKASKSDFVVSNFKPESEVGKGKGKSWLIGDFKLSVDKALDYVETKRNGQQGHNQWLAMSNYAKKYQFVPITTFITFYTNESKIEKLKKIAIERDKVFPFVIPITNQQK
ncbi:MAG: hypothetical protein ACKPCM_09510, partial [Pseudanabaena sp.]